MYGIMGNIDKKGGGAILKRESQKGTTAEVTMERESYRRNNGESVMEEEWWRMNHGGGILATGFLAPWLPGPGSWLLASWLLALWLLAPAFLGPGSLAPGSWLPGSCVLAWRPERGLGLKMYGNKTCVFLCFWPWVTISSTVWRPDFLVDRKFTAT